MTRPPITRAWLADDELVVDSFAGGGGASLGIEWALGRSPDVAINHDAEAIALHAANHPTSRHYCEDVWQVDPREATAGRPVGLMWLSPDCKHFSKAKGGKPVSKRVRGLAWVAVRWAVAVRPRVIVLENVEEFQTWGPVLEDGRPCPRRKGLTFRRFVGRLRNLGYQVEWRELRACDYGAPTIRKRLFLVARSDGQPIRWPRPTHGKLTGLPWRTAAECIDFSLPCLSIFATKEEAKALGFPRAQRPLAAATMRRIARGIDRFVTNAAEPFIVSMQRENRPVGIDEPLQTVTTQGNKFNLVAPLLVPRYGEREGQAPRSLAVDRPLPTIVPSANGASLVAAFLAKHYGGNESPGWNLELPLSTATTQDHHHVVTSHLVQFNGSAMDGQPMDAPVKTLLGKPKFAEVRAFLAAYYGNERDGGTLFDPVRTVTAKDRMGLVTVAGEEYVIADIGMRMLAPRELYRAQGFPDSYRIEIEFRGRPLAKTAQVRMVGNSVCPQVAAAIIAENLRAVALPAEAGAA